jgi:hypothetical protein
VEQLRLGDITVHFQQLRATSPRGPIHLTHRDFEVLKFLAKHVGHTVPKTSFSLKSGVSSMLRRPARSTSRSRGCGTKSSLTRTTRDSFGPFAAMDIVW